ncbi:MAG: class I SAM-dependent methyltransferase [Pirellulales bacterium]|nr:class I SAM-dependent methyltransferase [Pirellulales bacterium]
METDYNTIAALYKRAKEQPWRDAVETYSLMNLVGDLSGKRVVDVACGEGFFTRKLRQQGAAEVLGVDISERMIELACAEEAIRPFGIDYRVEDARDLGVQQDFDLAVSAWLLVYAHDRAELARMCQGLARRLRPGGRFVTLTTNPGLYHFAVPDYTKYGFTIQVEDRVYEGAPIEWTILLDDTSFGIENYYLPLEAYEAAFLEAGFREVKFHTPTLSPAASEGSDYWTDFLERPPAILLDCVRA